MNQDKMIKRELAFQQHAKAVFNSDKGKTILAYLKDSYVDNSAMGKDPYETAYKLGQKEFVQSLIRFVKEPDQIDDIIVNNNYLEG